MVPYFLFLLTKQISLVVEKEGTVFHGYEVRTIRNVLETIRNTLVVTKQKYFFLVATRETNCQYLGYGNKAVDYNWTVDGL